MCTNIYEYNIRCICYACMLSDPDWRQSSTARKTSDSDVVSNARHGINCYVDNSSTCRGKLSRATGSLDAAEAVGWGSGRP